MIDSLRFYTSKIILIIMKDKTFFIYLGIFIVIIIAAAFFIFSANNNYHSFRGHQVYFRNNTNGTIQIENWMTPQTIIRHFNITQNNLFEEIGITNSTTNLRTPLVTLCKSYNISCSTLIQRLNSQVLINAS